MLWTVCVLRPFSCFYGLTSVSKTRAGFGSVSHSGVLPLLKDMYVSPQHYLYWGHGGFTHTFTHSLTHLLTLHWPANISISKIKGGLNDQICRRYGSFYIVIYTPLFTSLGSVRFVFKWTAYIYSVRMHSFNWSKL